MTRSGVFFVVLVALLATIAYVNGREHGAALPSDAQNAADVRASDPTVEAANSMRRLLAVEVETYNQFMSDARPNFSSTRVVRECETGDDPDAPESVSFTFDDPCPPEARTTGTWNVVYQSDNKTFDHLEEVVSGE
jgi:hypothetical protein